MPAKKVPAKKTRLLSGGNPQIAKGEGNAPVNAYIAALSGWKRDMVKRLDTLIVRALPDVTKAVKWNTPLYGTGENNCFLGIHMFTSYVKVTFMNGASLQPLPPDKSKMKNVRYLNIREHDNLDEAQFISWVKQASQLPGEKM